MSGSRVREVTRLGREVAGREVAGRDGVRKVRKSVVAPVFPHTGRATHRGGAGEVLGNSLGVVGGAELLESTRDSTGALPEFLQEHPGHALGRIGSGAILSTILSGPVGGSVSALGVYGGAVQAAQVGNSVTQGAVLGVH